MPSTLTVAPSGTHTSSTAQPSAHIEPLAATTHTEGKPVLDSKRHDEVLASHGSPTASTQTSSPGKPSRGCAQFPDRHSSALAHVAPTGRSVGASTGGGSGRQARASRPLASVLSVHA